MLVNICVHRFTKNWMSDSPRRSRLLSTRRDERDNRVEMFPPHYRLSVSRNSTVVATEMLTNRSARRKSGYFVIFLVALWSIRIANYFYNP